MGFEIDHQNWGSILSKQKSGINSPPPVGCNKNRTNNGINQLPSPQMVSLAGFLVAINGSVRFPIFFGDGFFDRRT